MLSGDVRRVKDALRKGTPLLCNDLDAIVQMHWTHVPELCEEILVQRPGGIVEKVKRPLLGKYGQDELRELLKRNKLL